jgi:multicomponent Na+:H+ antiporter subunit D
MLSMFSGIVSSILPVKWAKWLNTAMITIVGTMSCWLLLFMARSGIGSYTYMMGHFPAPWGNELRVGVLEAGMALFFCVIMLLSLLGGRKKLKGEVEYSKHNIYYILCDLLLSSLLALIYTNDLFTAYVFVEINTIAAAGLIMIRQNGRCIEASVRYMIMSLLGSGLLLLGISMLYDMTGHLLMSNIKEQIAAIMEAGAYRIPMIVTIGIITVGLAIKSALFPFHSWLPDAYGYATVSSGAILSSLVSKGYIFLLIKIFYRVIGFEYISGSNILNILFLFGLCGMIFGSISAIWEKDIRRMIAFSSVAQIGYIYMGFGLGTEVGMIASVFHILTPAATKSLLFKIIYRVIGFDAFAHSHILGLLFVFGLCGMIFGSVSAIWEQDIRRMMHLYSFRSPRHAEALCTALASRYREAQLAIYGTAPLPPQQSSSVYLRLEQLLGLLARAAMLHLSRSGDLPFSNVQLTQSDEMLLHLLKKEIQKTGG